VNPFALGDDFETDAFGLGEESEEDLEAAAAATAAPGNAKAARGGAGAGAGAAAGAAAGADAGAGAAAEAEAEAAGLGYHALGSGAVTRRRPWGRDTTLFDYEVDSEVSQGLWVVLLGSTRTRLSG